MARGWTAGIVKGKGTMERLRDKPREGTKARAVFDIVVRGVEFTTRQIADETGINAGRVCQILSRMAIDHNWVLARRRVASPRGLGTVTGYRLVGEYVADRYVSLDGRSR